MFGKSNDRACDFSLHKTLQNSVFKRGTLKTGVIYAKKLFFDSLKYYIWYKPWLILFLW